MGTNYYVRVDICECCGRYNEYHIGKSSGGRCFSLHIEPENGIKNLKDVCKLMEQGHIYNEYGDHITQAAMYEIITYRKKYQSIYGLKRHRLDDWHCVGHGDGDYDLIIGEFS